MSITFTKMQGLGNDFVVIDATRHPFKLTPEQIIRMADRHYGVGFDQLLILETAPNPHVDFGYRIFNADGTEVAQCGNGARCIGRYIADRGLSKKNELTIATMMGELQVRLEDDGQVTVNMGVPRFIPSEIPFFAPEQTLQYDLEIDGAVVKIGAVSMGNPHAVLQVENVDEAPVAEWGPQIERHARFPKRTNVGFMQILNRQLIRLRVFERGTGETLACGSGACAAVVIGRAQGLLDERVNVLLPGGQLSIIWEGGANSPVWMTGPAKKVFKGEWWE